MPLPVERESELAVGGFRGIKKIKGLLVGVDAQDPPSTWENQKRQVVKVDLEDVIILEMFGDEEPPVLKDNKFSFYIPYVAVGQAPHRNSIYSRCWLASAKELGHLPSEFIGEYVTLEKQPRLLFQQYEMDKETKKPVLDEEGNKIKVDVLAVDSMGLPNHFCFVDDDKEGGTTSIDAYVRDLIIGLNEKAALRKLLVDPKAKQYPQYKDSLRAGTLGAKLSLVVKDGKFEVVPQKEVVDEAGSS